MLLAHDSAGSLTTATPSARGTCPLCGQPVHARTGQIVSWHWAHLNLTECDTWSEPETQWHRHWKYLFRLKSINGPACEIEKVIERDGIRHRADVRTQSGIVLELQHSSISPEDIQARERFYPRLWWLFNAQEAFEAGRLYIRNKGEYHTFQWMHPRKTLTFIRGRLFLHLDADRILAIRKMNLSTRLYGWGNLLDNSAFQRLVRQKR